VVRFDLQDTLIAEDGRVIPILVAIGNHEVQGGFHHRHDDYEQTDVWRERFATYFYSLFAFPGQPGYNVIDFGDYMSLIALDTFHTNPIEGEQTQWLERTLSQRVDVPHVFPFYHIPAYGVSTSSGPMRRHVVPLFEKYGVRIAFENHGHVYKRTHPIRDGKISEDGIVYVGDGAWGVNLKPVRDRWYLAKAQSVHHFIVVTIHRDQRSLLMVDADGNIIDRFPESSNDN
jgi:hypothetical protein